MSAQSDFEKIGDVLSGFFRTRRIKESLTSIREAEIRGWEKWWQTELAIYLAKCDVIADWDMEHGFDTDRRTSLGQDYMAIDIGFRLKNHRTDDWYFVELKQDDDYRRCIDRMCMDARKVFAAKKKSWKGYTIRHIACAGIFLKEANETVRDHVEEKLDDWGIDTDRCYLKDVSPHHSLLIF